MANTCVCGDVPTVTRSSTKVSTYCQSCGRETEEQISVPIKLEAPIISLDRASILKKIKNKVEEVPKKPKQIRDRTNYVPQRRSR